MRNNVATTKRLAVFLTLLLVAAACTDETPITSPDELVQERPAEPAGAPGIVASVTCAANVLAAELSCGKVPVVDGQADSGPQRITLGGQGVFVQLVSNNVSYDAGSEIFQADVQVANRIAQGIGSADGLTVSGIRVFFHSGPTVTSGTGTVTVANADSTGTFTGSNQPVHTYNSFLPYFFISAAKTWQWNVPPTVNTFVFEVFVDADVVNPNGFVAMSPGSALMSVGGATAVVTGTPVDVVGRTVAGTVSYTSTDPNIASVDPTTGVVTAVSAGIVDIVGSTGGPEADGSTRITVDPPTAGFDIDLHFLTPVSASQEAAFTSAAARWGSLITGDLATEQVTIPIIACGGLVDEYVDDLAINVILGPIDGPGKTLGWAAPCFARSTGGLPAFGIMQFDTDDLAQLETDGQLGDVVLHEMGHVLGIGVLWDAFGLLFDDNGELDECFPIDDDPPPPLTTDPYFSGTQALTAFNNNGGLTYVGNKVPVEDDFGGGTRCVHWRESVLDNELMTGFTETPSTAMPLSEVTVKSLADMGYTVAASGWDTWSCPACAPPAPGLRAANAFVGGRQLINDVWLGPMYSRNEQGEIILVRPDRRR